MSSRFLLNVSYAMLWVCVGLGCCCAAYAVLKFLKISKALKVWPLAPKSCGRRVGHPPSISRDVYCLKPLWPTANDPCGGAARIAVRLRRFC